MSITKIDFTKAFKLKDEIIKDISNTILQNYNNLDFFDISLTKEFTYIEHLVSEIVDKIHSGELQHNWYSHDCEHCSTPLLQCSQSIEDRMDSIEQQLKELRKEMEDSIARYKRPIVPLTDLEIKAHLPRDIVNENPTITN